MTSGSMPGLLGQRPWGEGSRFLPNGQALQSGHTAGLVVLCWLQSGRCGALKRANQGMVSEEGGRGGGGWRAAAGIATAKSPRRLLHKWT